MGEGGSVIASIWISATSEGSDAYIARTVDIKSPTRTIPVHGGHGSSAEVWWVSQSRFMEGVKDYVTSVTVIWSMVSVGLEIRLFKQSSRDSWLTR